MIASLNGKIVDIFGDSLVVEVGGVGLQVNVPVAVRQQARNGDNIYLHTYLVVRQDALTLFGFESREEREFFMLLLEVNGIGPRLALSVLSVLSPDAIRRAVFHEQAEVFSRVPGVGKKTAQKILLQLQDRLPADSGLMVGSTLTDLDTEILAALTSLGYSVVEAQAALQSIPRDTPQDLEVRLRQALQYFS
ncbi:MAG TPA: Holliday junction branch migration protein RuvA [Anaerolineales bacterium]|nr:Holliday junction branch migration protein RuvA [Anaerolineales bacterium]